MKQAIIPITLLALSSSTALWAYPKDFSGPFVGGMIGGSSSSVGASAFTAGAVGFPSAGSSTNSGGGVEGGAMTGYLHKLSSSFPLHIGIAAGATAGSNSGSESTKGTSNGMTLNAKHKHRRNQAFQGFAIFGYPISNTIMPFGLIGWENALWKHTVTTTSPMAGKAKTSDRLNGLLFGGGILNKITQNASVGLMYQGTTHFSKQKSKGGGISVTHKGAQNHKFMTVLMYTIK